MYWTTLRFLQPWVTQIFTIHWIRYKCYVEVQDVHPWLTEGDRIGVRKVILWYRWVFSSDSHVDKLSTPFAELLYYKHYIRSRPRTWWRWPSTLPTCILLLITCLVGGSPTAVRLRHARIASRSSYAYACERMRSLLKMAKLSLHLAIKEVPCSGHYVPLHDFYYHANLTLQQNPWQHDRLLGNDKWRGKPWYPIS